MSVHRCLCRKHLHVVVRCSNSSILLLLELSKQLVMSFDAFVLSSYNLIQLLSVVNIETVHSVVVT